MLFRSLQFCYLSLFFHSVFFLSVHPCISSSTAWKPETLIPKNALRGENALSQSIGNHKNPLSVPVRFRHEQPAELSIAASIPGIQPLSCLRSNLAQPSAHPRLHRGRRQARPATPLPLSVGLGSKSKKNGGYQATLQVP